MTPKRVSEEALAEAFGIDRVLPGKCCDSCHQDDEEGYGMCEVDAPDMSKWASVCCAVATSGLLDDQSKWDTL